VKCSSISLPNACTHVCYAPNTREPANFRGEGIRSCSMAEFRIPFVGLRFGRFGSGQIVSSRPSHVPTSFANYALRAPTLPVSAAGAMAVVSMARKFSSCGHGVFGAGRAIDTSLNPLRGREAKARIIDGAGRSKTPRRHPRSRRSWLSQLMEAHEEDTHIGEGTSSSGLF